MADPALVPALSRSLHLSVEVFPPAQPEGVEALAQTVLRLLAVKPVFVSVTYGAGGSTRERSLAVVERLMRETAGRTAAHVTCCACSRRETEAVLDRFQAMGVERFVALRGDVPGTGPAPDGYEDAVALISTLRRRGAADISVAAYPEVHPRAASAEADLDVLKAKCAAGAARAITQFFLDNDAFYRFRDTLARQRFDTPLVAGVLLFEDFNRAAQFARRCGTSVPEHVASRFAPYENDPAGMRDAARHFLADQVADLLRSGVEHIHLYTLNRAWLTEELFGGLEFVGARPATRRASLTVAA